MDTDSRALKIIGAAMLLFSLLLGAFLVGNFTSGSSTSANIETTTQAANDTVTPTTAPGVNLTGLLQSPDEVATTSQEVEDQQHTDGDTAGSDHGGSSNGDSGQGGNGNSQPPAPIITEEPPPVVTEEPPAPAEPEAPVLEPEPPTPVPNEAPQIVDVSPADGATGVAPDTNVVVTFSEEMDKDSAETAFAVFLPGEPGTFSWDPTGTVMTFDPASGFAYGTEVAWKVESSAEDTLGLGLEDGFVGSFRILRKSSKTLASQAAFDGQISRVHWAPAAWITQGEQIEVGVDAGQAYRGYLSFDLSSLPDDTVEIAGAELSLYQESHWGDAYGSVGSLIVRSYSFGTLDIGDFDWQCGVGPLCLFYQKTLSSSAGEGWKAAEVTEWADEDWQNRDERGHRSQYQLQFFNDDSEPAPENGGAVFRSGEVNGGGLALQPANTPKLKIEYIHP